MEQYNNVTESKKTALRTKCCQEEEKKKKKVS